MSETNDKIDMSLDDIIRREGASVGRRGRRGSYLQQRSKPSQFRQRSFSGRFGGNKQGSRGGSNGQRFTRNPGNQWMRKMQALSCRLMISNLAYSVTDDDLYELFASFGPLKKSTVHYDQFGQSLGTAELVFEMRFDAVKAVKQYNGVPLDGRPMRIRIIGDKPTEETEEYPKSNGTNNNTGNSRGRGTGNRGQFRGRQQKTNVTAEDLDKDLDLWRMETE